MRKVNMNFVEESKPQTKPQSLREQMHQWLLTLPEGTVYGEAYKHFKGTNSRSVRAVLTDLKNEGLVRTTKCRCHHSAVYHGVPT